MDVKIKKLNENAVIPRYAQRADMEVRENNKQNTRYGKRELHRN